ncbi:3-deoxy-D-arabinoheptulosonate-7-phosphate synthase [Psychromonas ingrahamii 37]|uniref:Phospho-2-dehydro-3-deoxyheptonate aldolase n=1 Tax=Psychromonas ingrahamii (strain DSM 17664 / CCUG 51855 / 37) TaxID=357804 RepID=A1SRN7_PSYIN|nr:3-deoxy-7-phosphoheptulonate synthase [Psychromonas ingrahamii]ABM02152.1 3-deoxy-D-arabinoheptulosonate-7-phosphate synthase [Psychromonas ingrahamii 37]
MPKNENIYIESETVLITPAELKDLVPASEEVYQFIAEARQTVSNIVHKKDPRFLVICGPCSIHDIDAAKDYATRLKSLHEEYKDTLYIVMRVYFEKPRTTVGWKGLINDPYMDDSFEIETGLKQARELLLWISELGLPIATEALDPISPQYLGDLFSWSAIGARTTESQTHREMASGLSMPVGFKNGTDGSLSTAVNAMKSASSPHRFMGINQLGQSALLQTSGNRDGHVILRGGGGKPNYDSVNVALAEQALKKAKVEEVLIVDCSHENSNKNHTLQPLVAKDVFHQVTEGNKSIVGIMLESNINEGNQAATLPKASLKYGVSVTDACIDWETTSQLLAEAVNVLKDTLKTR